MVTTRETPITVFWSWQSDLPPETTRNFVEDCLRRAAKKAGQAGSGVVAVDRDTKGVGGSPNISETILAKIVAADIFVWDASITTTTDRPSPNPNVLFELGFAVAALGWNRIIGVLNTVHGLPELLPFDLRHRRWPILYELRPREASNETTGAEWPERQTAREKLVTTLSEAISDAMASPPENLTRSDPDLLLAKRLWKAIDTRWMHWWLESRGSYPQVEWEKNFKILESYVRECKRPEMAFQNQEMNARHAAVLKAIDRYSMVLGHEMVPRGDEAHVLSVKDRPGMLSHEEYQAEYKRQLDLVHSLLDGVQEAWLGYVQALLVRYPELVHTEPPEPRQA